MLKHWRCTTVKTFLLVFKNLETRNRQHWTCNSYNGHSSKKSREKPRGHLQWGYYAGLHLWHRLFSPELFDGGLFGEQHYKFSSAMTLCSSSDSLLHWSRQHVCLTLTGHPQIQTLCKEPPLRACVRVCECVCLWGCWSRMLIQWKGAVWDTGGRKNLRRVGGRELCESVCCSVKEGERSGLRNSEVVQESWAEPQCCVDETERVLFTSVERVRPKTSNIVHTQSANVINTSKIESADFCHTVWWLWGGGNVCGFWRMGKGSSVEPSYDSHGLASKVRSDLPRFWCWYCRYDLWKQDSPETETEVFMKGLWNTHRHKEGLFHHFYLGQ